MEVVRKMFCASFLTHEIKVEKGSRKSSGGNFATKLLSDDRLRQAVDSNREVALNFH